MNRLRSASLRVKLMLGVIALSVGCSFFSISMGLGLLVIFGVGYICGMQRPEKRAVSADSLNAAYLERKSAKVQPIAPRVAPRVDFDARVTELVASGHTLAEAVKLAGGTIATPAKKRSA